MFFRGIWQRNDSRKNIDVVKKHILDIFLLKEITIPFFKKSISSWAQIGKTLCVVFLLHCIPSTRLSYSSYFEYMGMHASYSRIERKKLFEKVWSWASALHDPIFLTLYSDDFDLKVAFSFSYTLNKLLWS